MRQLSACKLQNAQQQSLMIERIYTGKAESVVKLCVNPFNPRHLRSIVLLSE